MMGDDQIADLLLGERLIDPGGLDEARQQQQRHGGDLYTVLIENGHVDEAKTITLVARQLNIPCVSLSEFEADEQTLGLIPAQLASDHRVIPLGVRSSEGVYLAMSNPIDFNALEAVSQYTGLDVHAFLVGPLDLDRALERCYGNAIYQGSVAMFGSDPFAGPSVSQLLELPLLSEDFDSSSMGEGPGAPLPDRLAPGVHPEETFLATPSPLIHAPSPLLSSEDLAQLEAFGDEDEEILEVELEGFADNQAEDIFEVRSSRIFMVPDQLSESGRQHLLEAKAEQSRRQSSVNNRTMMGYFRVEDESDAEAASEDEPDEFEVASAAMSGGLSSHGEASRAEKTVSVHLGESSDVGVHLKESMQLAANAAGERSQIGMDSYLRAFPRELTERSVRVLHQAYQSHDMVEVMDTADVGDLIRATVRVLLRSGLLREADLLRELVALHKNNHELG